MEISTIVLHELNTTQGNNGLNHNISQAVAPHLNADVRALSKLQNLYLTQRKSKPTSAVVPKKNGSKLYVKKKKRKRCISEGGEHAINTVATPPSNGKHLIGHPSPDTRLDTKAHTETHAVASEGNDAKKSKADLPPLERRNSVTLPLPVRALSKIKQRWKNGSSDNLAKATTLKGSTECLRVRKDQLSAMPLPETADNKGMKKKLKAAEESDATLDAIMKERSQAPVTSPQFLASHALLAGDEDELVMLKQCRESTLMQLLEAEEKER